MFCKRKVKRQKSNIENMDLDNTIKNCTEEIFIFLDIEQTFYRLSVRTSHSQFYQI